MHSYLNMRITGSRDGVSIKSRSRKRGADPGPAEDPFAPKGIPPPLGPKASMWVPQAGGEQRVTQNI